MKKPRAEQIDAILPQTQCGLCSYDGCKPYANAIANNNEAINLCPPGGVSGLKALGKLTGIDPAPFITEMEVTEKPKQLVKIRETECIGCTKCIQACPVDAIMGAAKLMHTVIESECTGCELCIEPCPVDCIDLIKFETNLTTTEKQDRADLARKRFNNRNDRLEKQNLEQKQKYQKLKSAISDNKASQTDSKKAAIQAALARAKAKKK